MNLGVEYLLLFEGLFVQFVLFGTEVFECGPSSLNVGGHIGLLALQLKHLLSTLELHNTTLLQIYMYIYVCTYFTRES